MHQYFKKIGNNIIRRLFHAFTFKIMKKPMRNLILILVVSFLPNLIFAQFSPTDDGLTIIVTDGTNDGRNSQLQPPSDVNLQDPIRPLGMTDAIQAGAFLERPDYGITGFILIFCVNDSIGGQQGTLDVKGQIMNGVYRLIRQKFIPNEAIPDGMTPFRLSGTVFFLGIS